MAKPESQEFNHRRADAEQSRRASERFESEGGHTQTVEPAHPHAPAAHLVSEETLRGRAVTSADGLEIGTVSGLCIDSSSWRVEAIEVQLEREIAERLGAGRTPLREGMEIEIPTRVIRSVGGAVVLVLATEDLEQLLSQSPSPSVH